MTITFTLFILFLFCLTSLPLMALVVLDTVGVLEDYVIEPVCAFSDLAWELILFVAWLTTSLVRAVPRSWMRAWNSERDVDFYLVSSIMACAGSIFLLGLGMAVLTACS
jgi:hypothetical protein